MILNGIGVSSGIAIGNTFLKEEPRGNSGKTIITDIDKELTRFEEAKCKAVRDLEEVCQEARLGNKEEAAMIFEAHRMIIEDLEYIESITMLITKEHVDAEYAVSKTSEVFEALFQNMDNEYMKGRAADIKDVSNRLISALRGELSVALSLLSTPVIIIAKDLLPSDTIHMDKRYVLGIVTEEGGNTSHATILARSMGIPAVVGVPNIFSLFQQNQIVALDGKEGKVSINPSIDELKLWQQKKVQYDEYIKKLSALKGTFNITRDGVHIKVNANIASPNDMDKVIENEAEGVGLFRSEFLYMHSKELPSEDVQFEAYKKVLESIKGKVIIRTLDAGGDKEIPCLGILKDENPFLGYRAIRICLGRRDLFYTQLRALLRASLYGELGIMFPMISSLEEIRQVKELLKEVEQDLKNEGIPFSKDIEIGMMIETPAAVMLSDLFAQEVQFFSIGTNDLTQYIMAADRMNSKVAYLYDTHNLAVLRAIKMVTENAHRSGIWVGICGEAAADTSLIPFFLNIGIDELSVSANTILQVREKIQQTDTREYSEEIIG